MKIDFLKQAATQASAIDRHWCERIEAELVVAEQLCVSHPGRARSWRQLIARALSSVEHALAKRGRTEIPAIVAEAESILAPLHAVAKRYTIHCVGHAHIDMNWMWSWPETVSITLDTFQTVLRLMDEFPAFRFSQSQASTYAIVEEYEPALLDRIARRVREGRWEVTASHWVECDKNMTSAESLCRHLLLTRRYMHSLFGLKPEDVPVDWSPDTFGHCATVPTYLRRGGIRYLYLHRPGVYTASKPGAFWWEGPDGARVLVRNDMELAYNGVIGPHIASHMCKFIKLTGGTDYMFVFGVGDHGGGPTRRDILCGLDMNSWPIFPNLSFSTARRFFEVLEKQAARLPVLKGELNTEFTGCYTTQSLIKRSNRFAENRLLDAETAAVLAACAVGHDYPSKALEGSWRRTLFSHFHDILPGSGVHDTRTYTHGLFQQTIAATSTGETQALRRLASHVDTAVPKIPKPELRPPSRVASALGAGVGFRSDDGSLSHSEQSIGHGPRPFVVFSTVAFDRSEIVEATIWDNDPLAAQPLKNRAFVVERPDGARMPAQMIEAGNYWGHAYAVLAFPATAPGLGYCRYIISEDDGGPNKGSSTSAGARQLGMVHHCPYAIGDRVGEGLENEYLRLNIDMATGGIRSLRLKKGDIELMAQQSSAPILEYAVERPHGMSAWVIDNTGPAELPAVVAVKRTRTGPYKAALEIQMRIRESSIKLSYELRAGDPRLYMDISADWFQRGNGEAGVPALSLVLPFALQAAAASYEIPFGAIARRLKEREEVPALQWAGVHGRIGKKTTGCLLLNDSKHGHSLDGSILRLTLIRSAYDPDLLPEIGQHRIRLALMPFSGVLPVDWAIRQGQAFNRPMRVVGTDVHSGSMPSAGQFFKVESRAAVLSAVKQAEEGDDVVLRVYNPSPKGETVTIEPNRAIIDGPADVASVDLHEQNDGRNAVTLKRGAVLVKLGPKDIVTARLRLGKKTN